MTSQFKHLGEIEQQYHPTIHNINHQQKLNKANENYEDNSQSFRDDISIIEFITSNKLVFFIIIISVLVVGWSWTMEFQHFRQNFDVQKLKQIKSEDNQNLPTRPVLTQRYNTKPQQIIIVATSQNVINSKQQQAIQIKIKQQSNQMKTKGTDKILEITKTTQQLQQIIKNMQHPKNRPPVIRNVKKSTHKQNQVYFAYSLSQQPNNQDYLQAQYYYYNKLYKISEKVDQLSLCAVIVGRNLGQKYKLMIDSIIRQNYSNYHLVWVDDYSDDNTALRIQQYIEKNTNFARNIQLIKQQQRKYALFNRNLAIKTYCQTGQIIIDLDADDWLIGNQVFKVVNKLYQDKQLWACYFNNIIYSPVCHCPLMNADTSIPDQILLKNSYRTNKYWRTTQLRTYKKQIYDKINENDFMDQKGQFCKWKSDAFINYSLVQLAGAKHVRFLDQFFYYYNTSYSLPSNEKSYCRLTAKSKIPYMPLQNLLDTPKKQQNYKPPEQIAQQLQMIKMKITK